MQVVTSAEYFEVVAVRYHALSYLVYFFRLLGLPATLTEYDIRHYIKASLLVLLSQHGALRPDEARLLRVLQVVAMAFRNLAIDGLLHPSDLVHERVALLLHHLYREAVFGIDDPYEEESILLQFFERDVHHLLIVECVVCYRDTSRGIGRRELPWRITGNNIEKLASMSLLTPCKVVPIKFCNIVTQRDRPKLLDVGPIFELL